MRVWILIVALAAALLPGVSLAASTPTPAPAAKPNAGARTPTSILATATRVPATPTVAPTATAVPPTPTTAPTAPVGSGAKANSVATPGQRGTARRPEQRPASAGAGSIHGVVFYDDNADGETGDGEAGMHDVEVTLSAQNGAKRTTHTDDSGAFGFDGLGPGTYHVEVTLPADHVGTTDAGEDIDVKPGEDGSDLLFGLIVPPPDVLRAMHGLPPEDGGTPSADDSADDASDEQIIALSSVTSLPLRFAEGRDLMAQVGRRVLGDGLVWLGVPFRSQIDGGDFQYVNCGPASLTMVLAAFGLDVGPSQVRDYLNSLIDNYNTDLGTSLDVLARIAKDAGLTPMDLYSDQGGYRNWSTDAVRWHVQHGRPVITLVKYRDLPGHGTSLSEFDHYIVISGLTPNGFIYNDAAFATTLGYGLEISDVELEYAWENSTVPHHAVALGLDPDRTTLSFPEAPRRARPAPPETSATARTRQLAQQDEAPRPVLTIAPMPQPAGPLITMSDRWQDEVDNLSAPDDGVPLGLNMTQGEQPALEPTPGIGSAVPKLLLLVGSVWLLWLSWAFSGRLVRWRPRLALLGLVLSVLRR